jgi:hypothetical protein
MKRLLLMVLLASVAAGCGGHSRRLADGDWYGKIVAVDVAHRTVTLAPACRSVQSTGWIDVQARDRVATSVLLSRRADLEVYYRPGGNAARGHGQPSDLTQLADVASRHHDPDFPPGWFVTVRDRVGVSVHEDSGVRSAGTAEKRKFACVWSRSTRAFVDSK